MVIVVEGIDRVGKSTLVNLLNKRTGYKVFKKDREYVNGLGSYSKDVDAFINYGTIISNIHAINNGYMDNIIFDRFQWTEAVYGYIDRKNKSSYYLMKKAEKKMLYDKWLMVYVRPTDIKRSSAEHGKDLSAHLGMYENMVNETELQCVICDFNSLVEASDRIIDIIRERG